MRIETRFLESKRRRVDEEELTRFEAAASDQRRSYGVLELICTTKR